MSDIEDLIRRYVIMGKPSPKGFHQVKCAACGDYKERGGFKFEDGSVTFHCFNCNLTTGYDPKKHLISAPKKFTDLLSNFNIPDSEVNDIFKKVFLERSRSVGMEAALKTITEPIKEPKKQLKYPSEIALPDGARLLSTDPWSQVAQEYLRRRGLSDSSHPFMVADGSYEGRLIIPYYFKGKIIYWQGRALDESITPKYKNPVVAKDNIFFNMDELYRFTDEPLFVSEGATDSLSIGQQGIALLGSTLTEFKTRELVRVSEKRQVIFLVDKNKNGFDLGSKALDLGFSVCCFPDNIDDANHALQRHGQLWLLGYISLHHSTGFEGRLTLKMKCK